jgi:predicted dehydrogenase
MSRRESLGVGLVGAGAMGRVHAMAYAAARAYDPELPPVRLKVVAEASTAGARAAADRLGFERWTADWQLVVSDPEVSVVSVAAPNDLHAPVAVAAAGAGKHVLCEKPLATCAVEAQAMWRAAEAAGVVHMVNFNYRQLPAVQFARSLLHTGRVGRVRHFRGTYLQDWGNDPEVPYSWKFQARRSGAGVLAGIGSHLVDLARYLVGEPAQVVGTTRVWVPQRPVARDAQGSMRSVDVDVEDAACLLLRFAGGALGVLEVSRCAPGRKNHLAFEVHGESGSVCFDAERPNELGVYLPDDPQVDGFRRVLLGPAHSRRIPLAFAGIPVGFLDTVAFQVCDFLRAVVRGEPASPDFHDGWRVQAVLDAALESDRRGGWVEVVPGTQAAEEP